MPEQEPFFHIRSSDVLRKLWRTYAAVNNLHAWTALNIPTNCIHKNSGTDLKSLWSESDALFLHLSASDNEYAYRALTGGWEDFFEKSLKVAWCIGTNPVITPPGTTFLRDSPVCTVFGAACLSRQELLAATVRSGQSILFHPMIVKNTARVEWFTFFDKQLSLPNPDTPIRISALYKRGHCRLMNAWSDRYESRGKCTVLASMTSLQFKQLLPFESSQVQDEGMWELCLLEKSPLERFNSLDTTAIRQQLSRLTHRKKHHLRYPNVPFVFQDRSTHHQRESALKEFWKTWESLAEQRSLLFKSKRIPWEDVDKNLQAANKLLLQCPCPHLARIARLASIPIGRSLRTAGILIYAVIRRYAAYVGQLGWETRQQRTPVSRLHEHIRRAKYFFNHFTGQCHRNLRTTGKLGNRPSLARVLAWVGGHKASILPLQQATPRNIDARERATEAALARTLNGVTSFGGVGNCELIFSDLQTMPETTDLQQVASAIITCRRIPFSAPQLVHILVESKPLLATN